MRKSVLRGLLAVLVVLPVAACSGSAEPAVTGDPTFAATQPVSPGLPSSGESTSAVANSPTSTALPRGPQLPAAASQNTPAGAVAFLEYYLSVEEWAYRYLDAGPLQRLAFPGSDVTSPAVSAIGSLRAGRLHTAGVKYTVLSAVSAQTDGRAKSTAAVDFTLLKAASEDLNAKGEPVNKYERVLGSFRSYLRWDRGRWYMVASYKLKSSKSAASSSPRIGLARHGRDQAT